HEYASFTAAPLIAATSPVTNQTIHRLPRDATTNAITNTMAASAKIAGHTVINSSACTTCAAVNIFTGGIGVGTVVVRSVSRSNETFSIPGIPEVASATASSTMDSVRSVTGS